MLRHPQRCFVQFTTLIYYIRFYQHTHTHIVYSLIPGLCFFLSFSPFDFFSFSFLCTVLSLLADFLPFFLCSNPDFVLLSLYMFFFPPFFPFPRPTACLPALQIIHSQSSQTQNSHEVTHMHHLSHSLSSLLPSFLSSLFLSFIIYLYLIYSVAVSEQGSDTPTTSTPTNGRKGYKGRVRLNRPASVTHTCFFSFLVCVCVCVCVVSGVSPPPPFSPSPPVCVSVCVCVGGEAGRGWLAP